MRTKVCCWIQDDDETKKIWRKPGSPEYPIEEDPSDELANLLLMQPTQEFSTEDPALWGSPGKWQDEPMDSSGPKLGDSKRSSAQARDEKWTTSWNDQREDHANWRAKEAQGGYDQPAKKQRQEQQKPEGTQKKSTSSYASMRDDWQDTRGTASAEKSWWDKPPKRAQASSPRGSGSQSASSSVQVEIRQVGWQTQEK